MAKRSKLKGEYDLTTPCTLCGYSIAPGEILRTGTDTLKCPKCGEEFNAAKPKLSISTS